MPAEDTSRYWQASTRRLARRVNFGWWLDGWLGWVLAAGVAGSVALLAFRWMPIVDLRWVWGAISLVAVGGGVWSWQARRHRYESAAAARVRLEDALGLKARLSAAAAGVGSWPEEREIKNWPVQWRWQRPLGVFAAVVVLLTSAALVPLSQLEAKKKHVIEKPSAVKDVEKWVEELRKEKAADEESLKEVENKVADLLQRPMENWYEHGSLEAAGNLKEQTVESLKELTENLASAERSASALAAAGDALPQAAKDALSNQLGSAGMNLKTGGMKPNEQLLAQLQQIAQGDGAPEMTQEELDALSKLLQENLEALQQAIANSPELQSLCHGLGGEGQGEGEGEGEGDQPGSGGLGRGKADARLGFKKDETNLNTKKLETVKSQLDIQRFAPGDVTQIKTGEHAVNKDNFTGTQQGGAIEQTGDGGAAVWRNSLMPAERQVLQRYFTSPTPSPASGSAPTSR